MAKGRKPVPVPYNGITYDSVYDCAAAFDLSANAVRWRLKHNLPLEPALGFRRMVTYAGRAWTLRELAERCGVSPYTIARRLRRAAIPPSPGTAAGLASTAGSGTPASPRWRVSWESTGRTRLPSSRARGGGCEL